MFPTQLVDNETLGTVATSHPRQYGWFGSLPSPMSLDVQPEVVPMLDAVVLSFIICEMERRRDNL